MKDIVGIIILIFCFLLAVVALKTSDMITGMVAICVYLIGDRIFGY